MTDKDTTSEYYLKTSGDNAFVLIPEAADGWTASMNTNWTTVDTSLKALEDSADAAYAQAQLLSTGRKINHLVNGDFSVWQRGSSVVVNTDIPSTFDEGNWVADQWRAFVAYSGTITASEHEDGILLTPPGFRSTYLIQKIERFEAFRGTSVTFSIDARLVSGSSAPIVSITLDDGVTAVTYVDQTLSVSTDFTRITKVLAVAANATKLAVRVNITHSDPVVLRRAMLAKGSFVSGANFVASQRYRSLRQCQRFYSKWATTSYAAMYQFPPHTSSDFLYHSISYPPLFSTAVVEAALFGNYQFTLSVTSGAYNNTANLLIGPLTNTYLYLTTLTATAELW